MGATGQDAKEDECQEWAKMAADRVPSIPGLGGLEPGRVILAGAMAPGPVPL